MFFKKAREEVADLQRQNEQLDRAKEAARLNFHRSLKRLAAVVEAIPLDDGLASIGDDLAGNPEKR